jgi:hypothetical protein
MDLERILSTTEMQRNIERLVSNGLGVLDKDQYNGNVEKRRESMFTYQLHLAHMNYSSSLRSLDDLGDFSTSMRFQRTIAILEDHFRNNYGLDIHTQLLIESPEQLDKLVLEGEAMLRAKALMSSPFGPSLKDIRRRVEPEDILPRKFVDRSFSGDPRVIYPDPSKGEYVDKQGNFHHSDGSWTDGYGHRHTINSKDLPTFK